MDVKVNSKIIRLSATAHGEYSHEVAYSELFAPHDMLDKLCSVGGVELCVSELDGNYNEVNTNIRVDVLTIQELIKEPEKKYDVHIDILPVLFDSVELSKSEKARIDETTKFIDKIRQKVEIDVIVGEEMEVGEQIIPAGVPITIITSKYFLSGDK